MWTQRRSRRRTSRVLSSAAATASTTSSSHGRPTIWTPIGKPSSEYPMRNDDGGKAKQVEPFAIRPGIEILHGLAFDLPFAFAMPEGGDCGGGTNQHGIFPHLAQNFFAQLVASQPGCKQRIAGMGRRGRGPLEKLAQDADSALFRGRAASAPRIMPPAVPKNFHHRSRASSRPSGRNWSTRNPAIRERKRGTFHSRFRLLQSPACGRRLEKSHAHSEKFLLMNFPHSHRRGTRIAIVRSPP